MMIIYKTNENHFCINNKGIINVYNLNQVKKLRVLKQRDLKLNIILLLSSIFCFSIAFFISEIFEIVRIFSFLFSGIFFLFSLKHWDYNYNLILIFKDYSFVKIQINNVDIEDVKRDVLKINKGLIKDNDSYSFSSNEMMSASS